MSKTTIRDVAAAACVSVKSVSRVINREPAVSDRLRDKVQAAIDVLGYVPNLAARSLAGARSFSIGILFDNPSPNYMTEIQSGAYKACRERDYHLVIDHVDCRKNNLAFQMESILRHASVDGFILTSPPSESDQIMTILEHRNLPFVRIAPHGFAKRSPAVAIDDVRAAGDVARHLWDLGHRRFGIVNGPESHVAARARRQGFIDWLAAQGCSSISESYGGFEFGKGIEAGKELIRKARKTTAIFATNDDSAAGVMAGLAQLGCKVPDDVSVVGFDDSWIALSVWPSLTTIHQPISEMAYEAAITMIDRNRQKNPPIECILNYNLVVRDSSGPPPK